MRYLEHFPDKDFHPSEEELKKIIEAEGEDCSWHNDAAPSWRWGDSDIETSMYMYVNPVDKNIREIPDFPRFIVCLCDDGNTDVYAGDSLDDALSVVHSRLAS